MGQTEILNRMYDFTKNNDDYITASDPHIADKNREPWRCGVCDILVFSRDKKGYPTDGSPAPKYASAEYPKVCQTCWDLKMVLDLRPGLYWSDLHNAWKAKRKNDNKLKPGNDYFAA